MLVIAPAPGDCAKCRDASDSCSRHRLLFGGMAGSRPYVVLPLSFAPSRRRRLGAEKCSIEHEARCLLGSLGIDLAEIGGLAAARWAWRRRSRRMFRSRSITISL